MTVIFIRLENQLKLEINKLKYYEYSDKIMINSMNWNDVFYKYFIS